MTALTRANTAALREALARGIASARGLNPDCRHEGPSDDKVIDGHWDRRPTANCPSGRVPWHFGWRNHARVADALIAGPLASVLADLDAANTRADRAEAEPAALKARIAILLGVIDAGKCESAFAYADEIEGSATGVSRRVRLSNIRDALEGVGDIEARKALGLLVQTIDGEPARAALSEGATDADA